MGYADIAGFRLGTCRPVRFINPKTKRLTSLTLHPLSIMDCTLTNTNYMNLNYTQALLYAQTLIEQTKKYNGDLCLLWHNTIFTEEGHKNLYSQLINLLKSQQ
jgi:hypothetical protein